MMRAKIVQRKSSFEDSWLVYSWNHIGLQRLFQNHRPYPLRLFTPQIFSHTSFDLQWLLQSCIIHLNWCPVSFNSLMSVLLVSWNYSKLPVFRRIPYFLGFKVIPKRLIVNDILSVTFAYSFVRHSSHLPSLRFRLRQMQINMLTACTCTSRKSGWVIETSKERHEMPLEFYF